MATTTIGLSNNWIFASGRDSYDMRDPVTRAGSWNAVGADNYIGRQYENDSESSVETWFYYAYVMQFSFSSIPAGATINSATLRLWSGGAPSDWWDIQRSANSSPSGSLGLSGTILGPPTIAPTIMSGAQGTQRDLNVTSIANTIRSSGGYFVLKIDDSTTASTETGYVKGPASGLAAVLIVDYTVPNTAPTVNATVQGFSTAYQWTNASQVTITWNYADADGDPQGQYEVVGSNNDWATWAIDTGVVTNSGARSYVTPVLSEGTWHFAVSVWDSRGAWSNWASANPVLDIRVDRTAPSASSVDGAKYGNGGVRFQIYGVADGLSGVQTVRAYMRNAANTAWIVDNGVCTQSGTTWYYDFPTPSDGVQGGHLVRFIIYDWANNTVAYDTTYYYDTVPPTATGGTATPQYLNVASGGTFRVQVTGVSDNISLSIVRFAVWTAANGQDDIIWYDGTNAGGGTWYKDVPIANHGNAEGQYICHVYAYDTAGNNQNVRIIDTYVDRTAPANASPTVTAIKSTSATFNWSAFSDGANSSGYLRTLLQFQVWTGSAWSGNLNIGTPGGFDGTYNAFTDNRTSFTYSGLAAGTQYRVAIIQVDKANNFSPNSFVTFTTNTLPVASISALANAGAIYNTQPYFRPSATDSNGSTVVLQIQIDDATDFATPLVDSIADTVNAANGFSTKGAVGSGVANNFKPTSSIGTGVRYARVRAYDVSAGEWGNWSSTYTFTIQTVTWATSINDTDTSVRKPTVDDIRTKINNVRAARGLGAYSFTDPTIVDWNNASPTNIREPHISQARTAITDIYTALGLAAPTWTDSTVTANSTARKGTHWIEARNALVAI